MDEQNCFYLDINIEPENGAVFVHSKQVPGLHLLGKSFQSLKPAIEAALKRLFRDNDQMDVAKIIWLKPYREPAIAEIAKVAICPLKAVA